MLYEVNSDIYDRLEADWTEYFANLECWKFTVPVLLIMVSCNTSRLSSIALMGRHSVSCLVDSFQAKEEKYLTFSGIGIARVS